MAQVAFVAAADLPAEVASSFAEATQAVPFSRSNLGIVQAATTAAVAVSRVADLPAEAGSGRWLRAFEAERSVAVPLLDPSGVVAAVLSVALDAAPPGDDEVASVVRAHGLTLLPAAGPNR